MENNSLLIKLNDLEARFQEISTLITDPAVVADMKRYVRLNKEYRELEQILDARKRYIQLLTSLSEAKDLLAKANVTASNYEFAISVPAYDEVHVKIAQMVCAAWNKLEFNVTVDYEYTIENNDYFKGVGGITSDICDDQLLESLKLNDYEVLAFDYNAFSADAYSMLSNFALQFSGMALDIDLENKPWLPIGGNDHKTVAKIHGDLLTGGFLIKKTAVFLLGQVFQNRALLALGPAF